MQRQTTWILAIAVVLAVPAARAADGGKALRVAPVFDLSADTTYGRFGRTALAGLRAGEAEAAEDLESAGMRLVIEAPIDTRGGLQPGDRAHTEVVRFLASGGRILFGAATTGDTNELLQRLTRWADAHLEAGDQPILLFAPVSTSILKRGDESWSNQDSRHVYLFRVAVSDEQALRELFTGGLRLRYDLMGDSKTTVSPAARELYRNLALFVEGGSATPIVRRDVKFDSLRDGRIDDLEIPATGYTLGFLHNLHRVLEGRRHRVFARSLAFWDPAPEHDREAGEVRTLVRELVRDTEIRAVGMVGYADFVARVNGLFNEEIRRAAESGDPELDRRSSPDSLWRFTGGTVKLEHLAPSPAALRGPGSYHGLHFLRTVPSEGDLFPQERTILRTIVQELPADTRSATDDLAEKVDDLSLHSYLGLQILSRTAAALAAEGSGPPTPDRIRRRLRDYDWESGNPGLRIEEPFFGPVEFSPEGDIHATRHIFYVRAEKGERRTYGIYQTDLRREHTISPALIAVLGLGFITAVLVLVNWKRFLGPRRRKVGRLGIENPYIYGVPVTRPEMYFGRREDFRKVVEEIDKGPFVLLITGGRRSGKSSFLHFMSQGALPGPAGRSGESIEVPDWVVPIYIDLQKLPNYPREEDFLRNMIQRPIIAALRQHGLEDVDEENEDAGNGYRRVSHLLEEIHRRRPELMILLLFDEIELLNERMREGTLSPRFPRLLRSWVQGKGTRVSIIFTGSPLDTFDATSLEAWAPIAGMMKKRNLGPLSHRETKALASEPVEEEVVVPEEVQEEFHLLSGGQPFLCQAICHMAINALNLRGVERLPTRMRPEIVEEAVTDFVENTPGHVDDMWSRLPLEEQYLLLLMAKRVDQRRELVTLQTLLDFAGSQRFDVSEDDRGRMIPVWKRTLERLVEDKRFVSVRRDHPDLETGQEGFYFSIDLMRRWLRRKPIWPVIDRLKDRYGGGRETSTGSTDNRGERA